VVCLAAKFDPDAKYWIIVASKDHVMIGVKEGICQANHGKAASLKRMKKGDGILFYSSKEKFEGNEKCQKFTAIGTIKDDEIYPGKMSEGLVPFRRRVDFQKSNEVEIVPMLDSLSFIKNKKAWGYVMRFGFLEIPYSDFIRIANAMGIKS
jgi:predicted RNA-binding protein